MVNHYTSAVIFNTYLSVLCWAEFLNVYSCFNYPLRVMLHVHDVLLLWKLFSCWVNSGSNLSSAYFNWLNKVLKKAWNAQLFARQFRCFLVDGKIREFASLQWKSRALGNFLVALIKRSKLFSTHTWVNSMKEWGIFNERISSINYSQIQTGAFELLKIRKKNLLLDFQSIFIPL